VLLDVNMPHVDGLEVCRRLRASGNDLPVLMLTARVEVGDRVLGLDAGADAYLVQPFEAAELAATLRALLRARAAERRAQALAGQLAQAVRARDEFLSVASHELKTPIAALQLRLDALRRELVRGGQQTTASRIDAAQRQIVRLTGLINDLLDVSRSAAGKFRIDPAEADLVPVVREVLERFQAYAQSARCEVTAELPEALPGVFDAVRIDQAVTNLLTNALKYGAGSPVELRVAREGEGAVVTVRDHGIGIAPEDQARIFERFERAVSARHYGGLGLGLFITREILARHGGALEVESAVGEGSRFTARFPLRPPAPADDGA
jgi:signal transduction histidine kinase